MLTVSRVLCAGCEINESGWFRDGLQMPAWCGRACGRRRWRWFRTEDGDGAKGKKRLFASRASVKSAHLCMKTHDKVPKRHDVEGAE